jgi:hypothetical protein
MLAEKERFANGPEALKTLLQQTQSYFETPTEENGKLILTLKQEVTTKQENYSAFRRFFYPLKKRLGLEHFIESRFVTKMTQVPGAKQPLPFGIHAQFQVDTSSLHIDRLRSFFGCDITKEQASESIGVLINNGWTTERFLAEFGLSRSTYFRYVPKKDMLKETQPEGLT